MGPGRRVRVYLDTHVVVALWSGRVDGLGREALRRLDRGELRVAPMVELELAFLNEIGRIRPDGPTVLDDLARQVGLRVCDSPYADVVRVAVGLTFTRDPFDRMIVAHAAMHEATLVSRDRLILDHYRLAIG